ncbi:hypothetical protein PILCRDRAFT_96750 [Piloderma croceum F 1598]|uniref:Las1-domain-containing protein n=1 Tax=Piloderma croceum (strain F 1598) TaxID=765440 RepID=A0A0C3FY96_PILCF|nr:hypothetical protein PILCRDRAFT_96750 [Piloderma croceum F 1598]
MRLPRRVPWASIGELDQVCSWIFSDELGTQGKVLAVNRLSAWKAITGLPHALESTLALLTAILQDDLNQSSPIMSVRQGYATAIIRMVNGLVDPLQIGAYARSIASIAIQLGLPLWLVELRHAATHEDLPSLELLRDAARDSLSWLLHNYFLPTLNPSTASQAQATQLRPLAPILKQYKSLLKITTRDASVVGQYKAAISSVQKDIERWISEVKVAANVAVGELEWEVNDIMGRLDEDPKERWALERLCDGLLEKGALVPLSKKKRLFSLDSFSPPNSSVALWAPLLGHIRSNHPTFPFALVQRIIAFLLSDSPDPETLPDELGRPDALFDMCLARWAFWIIDSWNFDEEFEVDFKRDVTVTLVNFLGPGYTDTALNKKAVTALLQAVCAGNQELEEATKTLLSSGSKQLSRNWDENDLAEMDKRLNVLLSFKPRESGSSVEVPKSPPQQPQTLEPTGLVRGWRLLDESTGWKPSPIGVYVGGS